MANDIDMWNDIEQYEKEINANSKRIANDLLKCYNAKFNDGDEEEAKRLKEAFRKKYGYWGKYY